MRHLRNVGALMAAVRADVMLQCLFCFIGHKLNPVAAILLSLLLIALSPPVLFKRKMRR